MSKSYACKLMSTLNLIHASLEIYERNFNISHLNLIHPL